MRQEKFYQPFRAVSFVVLTVMVVAIAYAATISVLYWTGIGV